MNKFKQRLKDFLGVDPTIVSAREYDDSYAFYIAPPGSKKTGVFCSNELLFMPKNGGDIYWDEPDPSKEWKALNVE